MRETNSRTWGFPSYDHTRIACNVSAGVKVAYYAALRKVDAAGAQHQCELATGVLEGQPVLIFAWEDGIDGRLPAIVDAIALLTGGTELQS